VGDSLRAGVGGQADSIMSQTYSASIDGAADAGELSASGELAGAIASIGAPAWPVRRRVDPDTAVRGLPRGDLGSFQRWFRYRFSWTIATVLMKGWFRITVVNPERLLDRAGVYAFNHLSWMDPLVLVASLPTEPRPYFYGPKQVDLRRGGRNRFMWWTGIPIPFSPTKADLRTSLKRSQAVFDTGGVLCIAPEGTIHVHEGDLLPFEEGAAFMAVRAGVPIVPVAITGISAAFFRGRVLVRIGEPIETSGARPTRQNVARFSALTWHAIRRMVDGDADLPRPGRLGRYLPDLFNDWGPGGREAASRRRGPDPADVRIPPLDRG
jgi:1-acyl-sn-glycerol-3-phosphate acyltransferase